MAEETDRQVVGVMCELPILLKQHDRLLIEFDHYPPASVITDSSIAPLTEACAAPQQRLCRGMSSGFQCPEALSAIHTIEPLVRGSIVETGKQVFVSAHRDILTLHTHSMPERVA